MVQKWPFFQLSFFRQYRPGKSLLWYSRRKKRLFRLLKQEVENVEKFTFFQRGWAMVLVEKWPFFQLCFLGNISQENIFYDIIERKNSFLGYKNTKLKKAKNWHFSKGVNPWFLSKNGHFSTLFVRQYRQGKYLLRYSRSKKRLSRL